jgi:hypothetical protein
MIEVMYGRGGELEQYAEHVVAGLHLVDLISSAPVVDYGELSITTVHRLGRFQVEMVSARPGLEIVPHAHPRMASIEFPLMGCVRFVVGDREDEFALWSDRAYARQARGRGVRINAGEAHRGQVGDAPSVFLSIQEWDGLPGSAMLDWHGHALTDRHFAKLHA